MILTRQVVMDYTHIFKNNYKNLGREQLRLKGKVQSVRDVKHLIPRVYLYLYLKINDEKVWYTQHIETKGFEIFLFFT